MNTCAAVTSLAKSRYILDNRQLNSDLKRDAGKSISLVRGPTCTLPMMLVVLEFLFTVYNLLYGKETSKRITILGHFYGLGQLLLELKMKCLSIGVIAKFTQNNSCPGEFNFEFHVNNQNSGDLTIRLQEIRFRLLPNSWFVYTKNDFDEIL